MSENERDSMPTEAHDQLHVVKGDGRFKKGACNISVVPKNY